MKRTLGMSGYTILEVMIVLVISGGLLTSVAAMISGQQRRTEFQTATREMESKMQDIFNDVESGVFPNNGQTSCTEGNTATGLPPNITASTAIQGTNKGCILLGKALQFHDDGSNSVSQYNAMFIVGNQHGPGGKSDALTIADAKPTGFYKSGASNSVETGSMASGLQLNKIVYYKAPSVPGGTPSPYKTSKYIAFMAAIGAGASRSGEADFNATNSDGGARIAAIGIDNPNETIDQLKLYIDGITAASLTEPVGAVLCLNDGNGGNARKSAVSIGLRLDDAGHIQADGQRTATNAYFDTEAAGMGC